MQKITKKDLEGMINRLNSITKSPLEPYTKIDGKFIANIGNYHIDSAYGGHKLVRMHNLGGGISDTLGLGFVSKKELYHLIYTYTRGIEEGQT